MFLRFIESTYTLGDRMSYWFKLFPSFCLTNTMSWAANKEAYIENRPELEADNTSLKNIGGDLLALALHFVFWIPMLFVLESYVIHKLKEFQQKHGRKLAPKEQMQLEEDVAEEARRVENSSPSQFKIRVSNFRKVYSSMLSKPFCAVEKTSFGIEEGECFALLGVNGAGKTTTFKGLTAETIPTSGELTINGYDVQTQFNLARKFIGYCPQYDALFELLTVEEHL